MTITPNPTADKTTEAIVAKAMRDSWSDELEYTDAPEAITAALRAHGLLAEGAPSEGHGTRSKYISPSLPGMIRNLWKDDPSENSVRTALKLAGDLIQELIDLRAACVAPQVATVTHSKDDVRVAPLDPEKVAEVLCRSLHSSRFEYRAIRNPCEECSKGARALCEAYTEGGLTC